MTSLGTTVQAMVISPTVMRSICSSSGVFTSASRGGDGGGDASGGPMSASRLRWATRRSALVGGSTTGQQPGVSQAHQCRVHMLHHKLLGVATPVHTQRHLQVRSGCLCRLLAEVEGEGDVEEPAAPSGRGGESACAVAGTTVYRLPSRSVRAPVRTVMNLPPQCSLQG